MTDQVTNVVIAGIGGQGVLKASDILAEAAFRAGRDVKKSDLHGMSQRGGSVTSDVRFGPKVLSPMVPVGEADYLVALAADQVEINRTLLKAGGTLIAPEAVDEGALPDKRTLNIALLGVLSANLDIDVIFWQDAIRDNLAPRFHEANLQSFDLGRAAARRGPGA
jgi:indolepyruvate ferredoxin oxidoreductase beta subunit